MEDKLVLGGKEFKSRFILGSGKYNLNLIKAAVEQGGAEIITLALRRANTQESDNILDFIPKGVTLLPNTSGARTAEEAVRIARLSRAMGCGNFVKIEVMRDAKYLFPDNYETVKATEILAKEGFVVLPYMNPDLNVARDLQNAENHLRHVKQWKWVQQRSWPTPRLQQREMCRKWHLHLNWRLKPEEKLILPEWDECLPEVEVHPIR